MRFHCLQCIGLWLVSLVVVAAMWFLGSVLGIIPVLALLLIYMLAGLGAAVIWVVLFVKALLGESFKLPVLGELAEGYSAED